MSRNKHPEITVNRILDSATRLFFEQGYEKTTIQDIVNDLDGLSKGAIYHHFASKEEIIEEVSKRLHQELSVENLFKGREAELTGLEKLKEVCLFSMNNLEQREWMKALPDFFSNPKFLAQQVRESVKDFAPLLIPLIQEGVDDGSVTVAYPKEAAEVMLLLMNIWVNPLVFRVRKEEYTRKIQFLKMLLDQTGLPVMDENVMQAALSYKEFLED